MHALVSGVANTIFLPPAEALRPYLSTYYFTAIAPSDGDELYDLLNPEWASVRFRWTGEMRGSVQPDALHDIAPAHFVGPTTRAGPFASRGARVASIGFLPRGWNAFMRESAHGWANRVDAASALATIIDFGAMANAIDAIAAQSVDDVASMAACFDNILLAALDAHPPSTTEDARIAAAHKALIDPATASVRDLADALQISERQLHRLSVRAFGFAPKPLLRRQRFLRTLDVIMRDGARNWSSALDGQYYDQSHFNRDFRAFFGMTPEQYRQMPHPVIAAAAAARIRALGAPLQALHLSGEPIAHDD